FTFQSDGFLIAVTDCAMSSKSGKIRISAACDAPSQTGATHMNKLVVVGVLALCAAGCGKVEAQQSSEPVIECNGVWEDKGKLRGQQARRFICQHPKSPCTAELAVYAASGVKGSNPKGTPNYSFDVPPIEVGMQMDKNHNVTPIFACEDKTRFKLESED